MSKLKPNNQDCEYAGLKLYCEESDISSSDNVEEVMFLVYADKLQSTSDNLVGRVKIQIRLTSKESLDVDLEQVLEFASNHCAGMYKRIYAKTNEEKIKNSTQRNHNKSLDSNHSLEKITHENVTLTRQEHIFQVICKLAGNGMMVGDLSLVADELINICKKLDAESASGL